MGNAFFIYQPMHPDGHVLPAFAHDARIFADASDLVREFNAFQHPDRFKHSGILLC